MSEWISVKDRVPPEGKYVLMYCPSRKYAPIWLGWYYNGDAYLYEQDDDAITHWMPLPEPPKEQA